jgi:hypothetical protein
MPAATAPPVAPAPPTAFWSQVLTGFPNSVQGRILNREPAAQPRLGETMGRFVFTDHNSLTAIIVPTPFALTHQLQVSVAWVRDDVPMQSQTGILSMPGMRVHTFTSENSQPLVFPCDFEACSLHRAVMPAPLEGGRPRLSVFYVTNTDSDEDTTTLNEAGSLFKLVLSGVVKQSGVKHLPQE